jgi:hypothetical protein
VPGTEIARLVTGPDRVAIFDQNIRRDLGRRKVNQNIQATAVDPMQGKLFWFYNNGITMVCDSFDLIPDPDKPEIKLENVQIVNGCQTAVSLQRAAEAGQISSDVNVLVRIYATNDPSFVEKITETTNNQNVIRARDLRANDIFQLDMQRAFKERYSSLYERKVNEFKDVKGADRLRIINNEKLGQAFLAVVLHELVEARAQKYKVFGEFYERIFGAKGIDRHMLAYLIYSYCEQQKASMAKRYKNDGLMYSVVTNGVFHIARIVGNLVMRGDEWNDQTLKRQIRDTQQDPVKHLKRPYEKSLRILKKILKGSAESYVSPNNFFKTREIEGLIDQTLKSGKRPSKKLKSSARRGSLGK